MSKKLLYVALLGGLGVAHTAAAQTFDDRWYLTGSVGFNIQDSARETRNAPFGAIGLGKFFNEDWSLDGELNYQNPRFDDNQDLWWSQYGISLDLRRHFNAEGRNWAPYVLVGLGYQQAREEFDNFPSVDSPGERDEGNLAGKVGLGIQSDYGRVGMRAELAYRADFDDGSVAAPDESWFGDVLASVGLIIPLGPEPAPPVEPAPPPPPPPPPPPAAITIDLKGVNFDFDKSELRPDAIEILNEVVEILKRYPDLRVEVAGHTDQCGKDDYNQALSERRAQAVYDYLSGNGIDAGRLVGPVGYGESRPLEDLGQDLPGCKSETNRRTELNVQN